MLIMDLLLPFTIVVLEDILHEKRLPKEINSVFGYPDFDVYEEQRHMGICS